MGILEGLLGGSEARSHPSNPDAWLINAFSGQETAAGVRINEESALAFSAVWRAVRLLAESIATMPLFLYRRIDGDGRERATDHPLYELLHTQPNREQTAFEWREMNQGHLELRGNAYNQIVRRNDGMAAELVPMHPDRVTIERAATGDLIYIHRPKRGGEIRLRADQVLHFRHLSSDGIYGLSTIEYAKQSFGLSLGAEQYGAIFFRNGARASGVLEHPGHLSDKATANLKSSIEEQVTGANRHRMLVLEEGMRWREIGINPEEAQFLETRKFQVNEIARWFGVPPHKLGDLERATFSNIEHQAIEFVTDALLPRTTRIEERLNLSLLSEEERRVYFFEFLVTSLLRGDQQSRAQFYNYAINGGWMNRNEPRRLENLNPGPPELDEFLVPLNMIPASTPAPQVIDVLDNNQRSQGRLHERLRQAYRPVFIDAASRIIRREAQLVRQAVKKLDGERLGLNLDAWLIDFYGERADHRAFVVRTLTPPTGSYLAAAETKDGDAAARRAVDDVATWYAAASREALRLIAAEPRERIVVLVDEALTRWEESRAEEIADRIAGLVPQEEKHA